MNLKSLFCTWGRSHMQGDAKLPGVLWLLTLAQESNTVLMIARVWDEWF